ncbi:DUF1611 domain-containing protein [Methanothermococcus sp. SCGC AD-155-C09]|nr:DUF1611 domain-containing protein [Methanothermococcus sp. SCGC AD-155-C09]
MIIKTARLSHNNKVSEGLKNFSNISISGYKFVENNKEICNPKEYDTFIWTKEILTPSEVKLWEKSIIDEIERGKNIYNMARLYMVSHNKKLSSLADRYGIEYFDCSDPNAFDKYREYAKLGLKGIEAKIITIMGTGRKCGKFTTSLFLRNELSKYLKVGTVGTEPHSKLCGIDEMVIPQVIPICHVASTLYGAIKKVDLNNKDLIIVSSQTGVFSDPLEVGTGRGGGVVSLSILQGSKPDYIILASNTLNTMEIERNIRAIEILSNKRVIGITINGKYAGEAYSNEDYRDILNNISEEFNMPVADVIRGIYSKDFVKSIMEQCSEK